MVVKIPQHQVQIQTKNKVKVRLCDATSIVRIEVTYAGFPLKYFSSEKCSHEIFSLIIFYQSVSTTKSA